jgi:hypothetical protein
MEAELPKSATIRDLKKVVGERMGVDPSKVFFLRTCADIVIIGRNILEKVL